MGECVNPQMCTNLYVCVSVCVCAFIVLASGYYCHCRMFRTIFLSLVKQLLRIMALHCIKRQQVCSFIPSLSLGRPYTERFILFQSCTHMDLSTLHELLNTSPYPGAAVGGSCCYIIGYFLYLCLGGVVNSAISSTIINTKFSLSS